MPFSPVGTLVMPLSLSDQEAELISRYGVIEDRHERLSAITGRKHSLQGLPESERSDDLLVEGCVSRVWLQVAVVDGVLGIRFATESVLLHGLVGLLAELYGDSKVEEAAAFSPTLLEDLGLTRILSPTRLNGLASVIRKIRDVARARQPHVDRRS